MSAVSPPFTEAETEDEGGTTAERLSDWEKLVSLMTGAAASPAQQRRPQSEQPLLPSTRAATIVSSSSPRQQPHAASAASSSSPCSSSSHAAAVSAGDDAALHRLSGFRIRDRLQSAAEVERRLRGHSSVRLDSVERWWKETESGRSAQADCCLFCILVSQSDIRVTAKGDGRYVIATLTDLQGRLLSCFLFDSAFTALRQREAGSVIAILKAKVSPVPAAVAASAASSSAFLSVSVSVSQAAQLLVLGRAQDFAFCSAYRREAQTAADAPPSASMTRCRNVVDISRSSYCDYHIAAEYRKIAGERVGLNRGGVGGERAGVISFGPTAAAAGRSFGQRRGAKGGWGRTEEAGSSDVVYLLPPEKQTAGAMTAATREKILAGLRAEQQRRRAETKPSLASILLAVTPKQPRSSSASSRLPQPDSAASPSAAPPQAAARFPARSAPSLSASAACARPAAAASSPAVTTEAATSNKRRRAEESCSSRPESSSSASASPCRSFVVEVRRAALVELFGAVDLSSPAGQRLLSASPAQLALLSDMRADERDEYWAFLLHQHSPQQQTATMTQRKTAGADQIQ